MHKAKELKQMAESLAFRSAPGSADQSRDVQSRTGTAGT